MRSPLFSRRSFIKTSTALTTLGASRVALGGERGFDLDFSVLPERYWAAPEVWANPWEDWKVMGGRLCNLKADGESKNIARHRHVQALTYELSEAEGWAECSLGFCLKDFKGRAQEGSTGFMVGIRQEDPAEEYRSRLLFGSGDYAGVSSEGELFIFRTHRTKLPALKKAIRAGEGIELRLRIDFEAAKKCARIRLSAWTAGGRELGACVAEGVPAAKVIGNIGISGNCPEGAAGVLPCARWAFSRWRMHGPALGYYPERAFGPILWSQYTLSEGILKLTAQFIPIAEADHRTAELQFLQEGNWKTVDRADILPLSWTAPFRIEGYSADADQPFRVRWVQRYNDGREGEVFWRGLVRAEPKGEPVLDVALFTCFYDYLFPNRCVAENVARANPDLLLFTGDQIYEGVGGWGIRRSGDLEEMCVNYLRKLALWGWSFREIMKDRPTVTMPDDHDVYHGNLWGDSGRAITLEEWNADAPSPSHGKIVGNLGGYVQPAEFVKAVERTQTSHLPDPANTAPLKQGITSYYTALHYGGVGLVILEDRKFKSGPLAVAQHAGPRPDHITDPSMIAAIDVEEAKLLGDAQLAFLRAWAHEWRGQAMKVAVSQTLFCGAATHHGEYTNYLLGDMDSNGWPQQGRRRAVDALRQGGIFMFGGDQHLPTIIRHGLDAPGDAGISFCTPAGCTGYQRWWRPEEVGMERLEGGRHGERVHTGCYRDGFGNIIDVIAVGNPPASFADAQSMEERGFLKSSGWSLMEIDKVGGTVKGTAWRVKAGLDIRSPKAGDTYPGWPMAFAAREAYGLSNPMLPEIEVAAEAQSACGFWPVVRVKDASGKVVSSGRMYGPKYRPVVFSPGSYRVEVLDAATATEVIARHENLTC